jgi:hypothetical protein
MTPDVRKIWSTMIARCTDPNHDSYVKYGGAGIRVSEKFIFDFEAFAAELGPRPTPNHTVDRIDPTRGYEPGNLRWATPEEQRLNTRGWTHGTSKYKGVHLVKNRKLKKPWRAMCEFRGVNKHIGYFETQEQAAKAYDDYLKSLVPESQRTYLRLNLEAA